MTIDWITANPLPAALAVLGAIAVLWVARPYVRAVLIGVAGSPARAVRGAALKLRAEARRIDARYKARIAEHHRQELEDRLMRLSGQLEGRLQSDLNRADVTLMNLRDSADRVIDAADHADPGKIAARVVAEVGETEEGERPARAAALSRAQTKFEAAARDARGSARTLKPEARRIMSATDKLRLIEHKLSRHAHDMNEAADRYERLLSSEERARGAGDASIVVPWIAALVVIAIAAAGAFLNFQLVERPMAELVGGGAHVAGLSLASLAAITLILLEAAAGVVLMEAAGATQLLPVFRRMSRRMMAGFAIAALFFLGVFSVVEIALAFTRDALIALDAEVLRAAAGDDAVAPAASLPVALIAQALLGGTIPWILAVVAIPAETVIHNTRFIVEVLWKQCLALFAVLLAALGAILRGASSGLMAVYDLAIFPALALEALARRMLGATRREPSPAPVRAPRTTRALRDKRPARVDLSTDDVEPVRPIGDERPRINGAHA